jgi:hypothetical protein
MTDSNEFAIVIHMKKLPDGSYFAGFNEFESGSYDCVGSGENEYDALRSVVDDIERVGGLDAEAGPHAEQKQ